MSIEALAHELIAHQHKTKRLLETGDIDGWLEALCAQFRAAESLRSHLLRNPLVITDDPAVKQLLGGIDLTDLDDADKVGSELLFSWISPAEYGSRLAQVTVLVSPFQVPFGLRQFLDEARQCYALGQFAAVQSLSRTILEAAVNDIAVRTGKMPRDVIEQDVPIKHSARKRIRWVAGSRWKLVYAHYSKLCTVVHGRSTSTSGGALGDLTKTIGFVQHLYEQNRKEIRSARKANPAQRRSDRRQDN